MRVEDVLKGHGVGKSNVYKDGVLYLGSITNSPFDGASGVSIDDNYAYYADTRAGKLEKRILGMEMTKVSETSNNGSHLFNKEGFDNLLFSLNPEHGNYMRVFYKDSLTQAFAFTTNPVDLRNTRGAIASHENYLFVCGNYVFSKTICKYDVSTNSYVATRNYGNLSEEIVPVVSNGQLYIVTSTQKIRRLDIDTLEVLEEFSIDSTLTTFRFNPKILFSLEGYLYSHDPSDDTLKMVDIENKKSYIVTKFRAGQDVANAYGDYIYIANSSGIFRKRGLEPIEKISSSPVAYSGATLPITSMGCHKNTFITLDQQVRGNAYRKL